MTQVITEKPIAVDSLDHINPYGCVNDNNSSSQYILNENGIFAGSVATYHCVSGTHVSVFPKSKWLDIFKNNKMMLNDYLFNTVPRPVSTGDEGFLFCATKTSDE